MNTPARRHFIRHTAAAAAAAAAPDAAHPNANIYELQLAQLAEHKRRLKALQSVARKIEVKREILPEYADYVAGVLSAGNGVQDDVLMTVMVWRIDAGDIGGALDIAQYALEHGLTLPDQYKRTTATLVAEEIADGFLNGAASTAAPLTTNNAIDVIKRTVDLTRDCDMPDEVRAKLHKALGYALRDNDNQAALDQLHIAVELHPRTGVKKDIERLERDLKNDPPPPASDAGASTDAGAGDGSNAEADQSSNDSDTDTGKKTKATGKKPAG